MIRCIVAFMVIVSMLLGGCGTAPDAALLPTPTARRSTPVTAAPAESATPSPTMLPTVTPMLASPTPVPAAATVTAMPAVPPMPVPAATPTFVVTNSAGRHISFVNAITSRVEQIEVGAAPWGIALAPNDTAYVATADGVAVVDTRQRQRVAHIPYGATVGAPQWGEYRPGGMGITAAPDGQRVYVGVFLPDRSGRLDVLDTITRSVIASVPISVRPFQVLLSHDGRTVYTIDHDTYTVTVVDTATYATRTREVAPFGNAGWGGWNKPHYAALRGDGHLLLPIQGRVLVDLDPASGTSSSVPLTTRTHQHGVALSPDERRLVMVGTGPAGDVDGAPQLTILDLATMIEDVIPLAHAHEDVVVSPDGRMAYVTGGHTFGGGGWDGVSVVDLQARTVRTIDVPDRPLAIVLLP